MERTTGKGGYRTQRMSRTGTPPRIKHFQSRLTSPEKLPSVSLKDAKLAKFVISAEFDNKVGSVIRHQIPKKIPGFKEYLSHLGELVIPSQSEHYTQEDYSSFILYKDPTGKYQLFPDDNSEEDALGFQHMRLNDINTIFENKSHDDDILFFYTVTKKIEDVNDARGAKIRSISIGTPLSNFVIFKHLITLTIQNFIHDGQVSHLISLFNTINSIDISLWKQFCQANNNLQRVLSLNSEVNNQLVFPKLKQLLLNESQTEGIRYKSGTLQYYPTYTPDDPQDKILSKIPINLSLTSPSSTFHTDLNLTIPILTFLKKLSMKLNSTNYQNFNIFIYSNDSKDQLCQFILSLSNFLNGFNNPYFHNDKILYLPLIDLSNFETLLKYDKQVHNTKIIGTNNIMMKENFTDFYDFWYDLNMEELFMNETKLELFDVSMTKTQDFINLCDVLIKQHHDFDTVSNTMIKFTIYEILKILKRDDSENELNLKDYYLSRNKNLVFFDWVFEFKIIRLIDTFDQYFKILQSDQVEEMDVDTLYECLEFMIGFLVGNVKGHLETFIHILEVFPVNIQKIDELVYCGDEIEDDENTFNYLFKPILFQDRNLQEQVLKLFKLLSNSELSLILDKRLNYFLIIAIEEFASITKNNI